MKARNVFISYSREDLAAAKRLEQELLNQGLSPWRDQESIYAGQQWPKAIGEAISSNDLMLLLWSKSSADSHFVEFEWSTAIALKKTIIPCLLDKTPLVPSLISFNGIWLTEFEQALPRILKTIHEPHMKADLDRRSEVLKRLQAVAPSDAKSMARAATMMMTVHASASPEGAKRLVPSSIPAVQMQLEGLEIGDRYKVIRMLGAGGMGAVYRVHDNELERDVALKVIRSDLAEDPSVLKRFKREIQLSSTVTHPNVLRVYDLGEREGIKFLTMQYVDGEDLADLLKREGRLPIDRLVRIFRQICEGLGAAHEKGILHRDLKPSNIMIDKDDTVYLMDFGLARSTGQSALTRAGDVMGTPHYMSPEQVKGETLDPQSDIYSLGVILYEMCTGKVPFAGDTVYQVMIQRVSKPPTPATQLNPNIPPFLQQVLQRSMAVEKSVRYASIREMVYDLDQGLSTGRTLSRWKFLLRHWRDVVATVSWKKAALAFSMLLLLVLGGWWLGERSAAPPAGPAVDKEPVSVLVADFDNRTGDPVFDGTLESTFIGTLEGAPFITSYNRSAARRVAAGLQSGASRLDENLAQLVSVREGINVIVTGSITTGPKGYEVETMATDAMTGRVIQAERETAGSKETVLPVVGKLAAQVRRALGDDTPESLQLAAAETFTTTSLEVAHVYSLAQESAWAGNWEEVIRYNQQAVELDPNFGRGYAALAVAHINLKRRDEAAKYYEKALALVDRMSAREKYRTLGAYYLAFARNYRQALVTFEKLVELFPGDSAGHNNLAIAYVFSGKIAEAVDASRRAVEVSPKNLQHRMNFALFLMYASDFAGSMTEANRVIEENPSYEFAYLPLALSRLAQGNEEGARQAYARVREVSSVGASIASIGEADLEMYSGRIPQAVEILMAGIASDERERSPGEMALKYVALAESNLALGRRAEALEAANKAVQSSGAESVLFPAARVFVQAGEDAKAMVLASGLEQLLQEQTTSYARLIEAEIALRNKGVAEAVEGCREALKLHESWIGHFLLGQAYVEAGHFPEALAELDACWSRRGETTDLCFADTATLRYLPPLYYWLARAQEGMGMKDTARENYQAFLKLRPGGVSTDPIVADARRRLSGL